MGDARGHHATSFEQGHARCTCAFAGAVACAPRVPLLSLTNAHDKVEVREPRHTCKKKCEQPQVCAAREPSPCGIAPSRGPHTCTLIDAHTITVQQLSKGMRRGRFRPPASAPISVHGFLRFLFFLFPRVIRADHDRLHTQANTYAYLIQAPYRRTRGGVHRRSA